MAGRCPVRWLAPPATGHHPGQPPWTPRHDRSRPRSSALDAVQPLGPRSRQQPDDDKSSDRCRSEEPDFLAQWTPPHTFDRSDKRLCLIHRNTCRPGLSHRQPIDPTPPTRRALRPKRSRYTIRHHADTHFIEDTAPTASRSLALSSTCFLANDHNRSGVISGANAERNATCPR